MKIIQPGFRRIILKSYKRVALCMLIPILTLVIVFQAIRVFTDKGERERSNVQTLQTVENALTDIWSSGTQTAMSLTNHEDVVAFARINRGHYSQVMLQRFDRIRRMLTTMRITSDLGLDIVLTFPKPLYFIYRNGGISAEALTAGDTGEKLKSNNYQLYLAYRLLNENANSQWLTGQEMLCCYIRSGDQGGEESDGPICCLTAFSLSAVRHRLRGYLNSDQSLVIFSAEGDELLNIGSVENRTESGGIAFQNGKWAHTLSSTSSITGWTLFMESRETRFDQALHTAVAQCLLILLATVILGAVLAFVMTIMLCRPYEAIANLLNQPAQDAANSYQKEYASVDDLGIIRDMIHHTKYQIFAAQNELESQQRLLKDAQFMALKSQINPHFLYNTLEAINLKALMRLGSENNEISDMICDLSQLMRLSMETERNLIPLREEIEHAKVYLKIQQRRFPQRFQVDWDVSKECLDAMVVALTLQPLLENAISHGVKKMERPGVISVRCAIRDGIVRIEVADNGPGFAPERLAQIQELLSGSILRTSEHVGLFNVHQRLRLTFSDPWGVSIESVPFRRTCVTMTFPLRRAESTSAAEKVRNGFPHPRM